MSSFWNWIKSLFVRSSPSSPQPVVIQPLSSGKPWMDFLTENQGQVEIVGGKLNPFVVDCFRYTNYGELQDAEPWCAATLCAALEKNGYRSPHSALAKSFENYGNPVDLAYVQYGDIVVFRWNSGHYHVSTFVKRSDGRNIKCMGGNQSGTLCVKDYSQQFVVAVRSPVKA